MSGSKNHQGESFRSRRLTLDDYLKGLKDLSDDDLAKVRNHIILDLMSFLILLFLQQLNASVGEEFTNRIFRLKERESQESPPGEKRRKRED